MVKIINENFVPAWESVAPVSVAVFDLGDGRTVRGTMGGEIALYFCRPDGKVFDIFPALHSPHATYWAIQDALSFYRETGATDRAINQRHAAKFERMLAMKQGLATPAIERAKLDERMKQKSDAGTRALGVMAYSKSGISAPEPVVVIEPGGLDYYKRRVHEVLSTSKPRTPQEWKEQIFVTILDQKLKGGEFRYDVDTLSPISVIED